MRALLRSSGAVYVHVCHMIANYLYPERSPRWTSGNPRMLLVLVREFESRRGEILNKFPKKKKGSTAESAYRG